MQNNSRSLWGSCLLGLLLLLLVAASRGMRLPRENKPFWQDCKDASQKILSELWKLKLEEEVVLEANTTLSFPQRIECGDKCDPDSLDDNKMDNAFATVFWVKLEAVFVNRQINSAGRQLTFQCDMGCLKKIHQGLHHYHKLLVNLSTSESETELENTLHKLKHKIQQLVSKVGDKMESSSPDLPPIETKWAKETLRAPVLLRLQSFAIVVARVISHCAALAGNAN